MLRVPVFLSKPPRIKPAGREGRQCDLAIAHAKSSPFHGNVDGAAEPTALQGAMFRRVLFPVLLAASLGVAHPALAADVFSSDWTDGLKSSARLIAANSANGALQAGVEIKLAPGAITYWRNPGDAGLPPTLSFEGSSNLAQTRVSFPAPRRLSEGGGEAFGYDRALILPIDVEAIDPSKPVELALKLNYAVCEVICVPAQANLRLALPADAGGAPSPFADAIAEAKALIPRPVEWRSLAADLSPTGENAWRICLAPQPGPKRDLFIEPPEAWWFDIKSDANGAAGTACFGVKLMQKPPDAALPVLARLTITGGRGPVETIITLNAGPRP
jgi:DsbC/DsbD-like thiol-disulfide interchange protein